MYAISEGVYARGKQGTLYLRRRIPAAIRAAYPAKQTHILRSFGAPDLHLAKDACPRQTNDRTAAARRSGPPEAVFV